MFTSSTLGPWAAWISASSSAISSGVRRPRWHSYSAANASRSASRAEAWRSIPSGVRPMQFRISLDGTCVRRQLVFPIALTRHFCYRARGRCLIENATQGEGTSEGENEETDQDDYAPRTYGGNQPALSSGGSKREEVDRKSTRLNSSHLVISYAVFCLKK